MSLNIYILDLSKRLILNLKMQNMSTKSNQLKIDLVMSLLNIKYVSHVSKVKYKTVYLHINPPTNSINLLVNSPLNGECVVVYNLPRPSTMPSKYYSYSLENNWLHWIFG
jgi:hypothetical protein